jgi:branched-chain amino acid transport system ATP-binding protein
MLEVQDVVKHFDGNLAVNRVSFRIDKGELTALIGPNAAGKTTLLDIISGFTAQDEGMVRLNGVDLGRLSPWRRARSHITRTFQHLRDIKALTCLQNVQLRVRGQIGNGLISAIVGRGVWRKQEQAVADRARQILAGLRMEDLTQKPTSTLSFGQRKMLCLAGALAHDGDLFLLDEPVSGLDPKRREIVAEALISLAAKGKHVLFVEHNLQLVTLVAQRVLALDRGCIVAEGDPKSVLASSAVIRAYTQ